MESDSNSKLDAALTLVNEALAVANTKYCVNCKWHDASGIEYSVPRCTAPQTPTDPVTGKQHKIACSLMRSTRTLSAGFPTCTIRGHWFVAKEEGA